MGTMVVIRGTGKTKNDVKPRAWISGAPKKPSKPLVQALAEIDEDEEWSPPPSGRCYVCERLFPSEVEDGVRYFIRGEVSRHVDCFPGSSAWMSSKVGRLPKYRKYFDLFQGGQEWT